MDIRIFPGTLVGTVRAIPSKSQAHRLLICAAFADAETEIFCPETNLDMEATAACLRSLGADILRTSEGYRIRPAENIPDSAVLPCGESGSTLRFLLPVAGALGVDARFETRGRLGQRPLSPLWEELERMGCRLSRPQPGVIRCQGKLQSGNYSISGGVSSQYISGLLFAAALLPGAVSISITGRLESRPYVTLTQNVLAAFGIPSPNLTVSAGSRLRSPGRVEVEGDWSNAAFFLAANALGSRVQVEGLLPDSLQGDRAVRDLLPALEQYTEIPCGDIPDLVPILSVVAAGKQGARFSEIRRLRLKESDRVETVRSMLAALGILTEAEENTLTVFPGRLQVGTVDAANDHRIAMAAAIAATVAEGPVTVQGAMCVSKSYPRFWEEFRNLGGKYEQLLR